METISELFDLKGQVAVVTGANKGIGKAIALRLAEAGASIMIIDKDAADATVDEIRSCGGQAQSIQADLSRAAEAETSIEITVKTLGDIHILVNNAGIFPMTPFLDLTEELWDTTIDVNLKSAVFCAKSAAKAMISAGHGGRIINIGSESAMRPPMGSLVHYIASKGGMDAFTRAAARELLPHGIRVNLVAPGSVLTVDVDKLPPQHAEIAEKRGKNLPLGRWGTPDDIAKTVLFMASGASDYIVGHSLVVDGGILWLAKLEAE